MQNGEKLWYLWSECRVLTITFAITEWNFIFIYYPTFINTHCIAFQNMIYFDGHVMKLDTFFTHSNFNHRYWRGSADDDDDDVYHNNVHTIKDNPDVQARTRHFKQQKLLKPSEFLRKIDIFLEAFICLWSKRVRAYILIKTPTQLRTLKLVFGFAAWTSSESSNNANRI